MLSAQPDADDHVDLDSIIKPLIDVMSEDEGTRRPQPTNKWVIKSDSQVRRLETTRIDLNTPNLAMPEIVKDKQDDQDWAYGEVIYVYMDRLEAGDSPSWEWWK